ncbi:hypothetical protein RchiOBHm_Chr1g0364491 [Rosa chinensis]|uniref:Uncharacterized protein n=1 Tax=Rosa chinensis TaxID=74649 RepID=A0A2P6SJR2_ROSCH|nr:hypothetical protein RchiOBHm_Chr1g0364491 [Rosa chinensis]
MTHVIMVASFHWRCSLSMLWIFPRRVTATTTPYDATSTAHIVIIFTSPTCGVATTCEVATCGVTTTCEVATTSVRFKVAVSLFIGVVIWARTPFLSLIIRVLLLAPLFGCIIICLTDALGSYGPRIIILYKDVVVLFRYRQNINKLIKPCNSSSIDFCAKLL